jgi:hypothetical protein
LRVSDISFRKHGVDTARQAAVSIFATALPCCLIRFIHKHHNLPKRVQNRKYFFEIGFRRPDPAVPEILEDDARNAQLTRPALNDKGLAGSDAPCNEVAHRKSVHDSTPKQLGIFTQPGFYGIETGNLVQRKGRFEKLQQALTLAFNHFLFHSQEPGSRDRLAIG